MERMFNVKKLSGDINLMGSYQFLFFYATQLQWIEVCNFRRKEQLLSIIVKNPELIDKSIFLSCQYRID